MIGLAWSSQAAATRFAALVPAVSAPQLKAFMVTYLTGTGEEGAKACIAEGLVILGKSIKEWRAPTAKDVEDAVSPVLNAFLAGGLVNLLSVFGDRFTADADRFLSKELVPSRLEDLVMRGAVTDKQARKIVTDTVNAASGEVLKAGWGVVIETAKGDESPTALSKLALEAVRRDRAIQTMVEAELLKALKKAKIPLK